MENSDEISVKPSESPPHRIRVIDRKKLKEEGKVNGPGKKSQEG